MGVLSTHGAGPPCAGAHVKLYTVNRLDRESTARFCGLGATCDRDADAVFAVPMWVRISLAAL